MIVIFGDGEGNGLNGLKNNVPFIYCAIDCYFQSQMRVVSSFLVWW